MLVERTELSIKAGQEEAFNTAMRDQGAKILNSVPGVKSVSFGRGVENPSKFLVLVEWTNMEAHTAFGQSPANGELRAVIRPHSAGGSMEHFQME